MKEEKELKEVIASLEERVKKLEEVIFSTSSEGVTPTKKKKISAKEFLMTKNIESLPQKLITLGYFLEHIEGMKSFNASDLETVFRSAKESLPANINDYVNKSIARGFIMEAKEKKDAKKAWHLTSTGESYVENDLSK
jgi:superfamily II helicase